jgi:hypothetical protein
MTTLAGPAVLRGIFSSHFSYHHPKTCPADLRTKKQQRAHCPQFVTIVFSSLRLRIGQQASGNFGVDPLLNFIVGPKFCDPIVL